MSPKKSVLLINPRSGSSRSVRMPLSLLALAAVLEGQFDYTLIDGNLDFNLFSSAIAAIQSGNTALIGVSVMPGPQVAPAIHISSTLKAACPNIPIVWGGYFPTLYPNAAMNAFYVDYIIRGQGEETLLELLAMLPDTSGLKTVTGLSWKDHDQIIHNPDRPFRSPDEFPPYPYTRIPNMDAYLRPSFMGTRTASHQAAIGCRFRCTFCGVVSMFNGQTKLQGPERVAQTMKLMRDQYGATAMQFYDNNFFDREETSIATLEAMVSTPLPWWCYARADALAQFSTSAWQLIRRSQLKMAFVGADGVTDAALAKLRKGTKAEQTLEAAARMREFGVIPEFSFILGGPEDPEAEIERTFAFIRKLKHIHPECEIILYFYSPTPQRSTSVLLPTLETYGPGGPPLPATPEEWTEPQWISWVCHQDAPWLTPKMRQRVKDFAKVLYCRFPTVQDFETPRWGKSLLSSLAGWRYSREIYSNTWELDIARRLIPLREPQRESL